MSVELKKTDSDPSLLYRGFQADEIDVPCMDIDQVVLTNRYEPAALIETTSSLNGEVDYAPFLEAVDKRIDKSPQRELVLRVAKLLNVRAYFVIYRPPEFEKFAVRRLDGTGTWHFTDRQGYIDWVHRLARRR